MWWTDAAVLLLACSGPAAPADREAYVSAARIAADDPNRASEACERISDPTLRADCGLLALESLARREQVPTQELVDRCGRLPDPLTAQECAFQVAEARNAPLACGPAGRFEDDCRLHLLSRRITRWAPRTGAVADPAALAHLDTEIAEVGLPPGDPRAASAYFRWILGRVQPLDRHGCNAIPSPERRDACWQTGRALFEDRLNFARDTGTYPCGGGPLPPLLATVPDEELEAILDTRERTDLCPPTPGTSLP